MDRDQAKQMAKVLEAYGNGAVIEYKLKKCDKWLSSTNLTFDFCACNYRIKREPIECELRVYESGHVDGYWRHRVKDDYLKPEADDPNGTRPNPYRTATFREITDE